MYPANFPGLGEALIFFCFFSSIKGRPFRGREVFPGAFLRPTMYPANFPGLGEALIFFCLLFLYQDKKRRS